jgi:hypothetical protein
VRVHLTRDLLGRRQHRLHLAEADQHDAALGPALVVLHHTADHITLAPGPLAEGDVVLGVPEPLQDDLLGGHRRDPPEVLRGVIPLAGDGAVLGELLRPHGDRAGLAVHLDAGVRLRALGVLVRGEQGGLDRLDHGVEGDLLLPLDCAQSCDVDVHEPSSPSNDPGDPDVADLSNSTWTRPRPSSW